jgi:hypothetical protein
LRIQVLPASHCIQTNMIVMQRVDSGGRATVVATGHYSKKLISISQQDCVAGAHTCLPTMTIKAAQTNRRVYAVIAVCQRVVHHF